MSCAKIVRVEIEGEAIVADLDIEPIGKEIFRLTIRGRSYPDRLRRVFGMGSAVTVISSLEGAELSDVFIAQDAPGGSEAPDGTYVLAVDAVLVPRAPRG